MTNLFLVDPSNSIIPEYEEKIKEEIESHYVQSTSDIRYLID